MSEVNEKVKLESGNRQEVTEPNKSFQYLAILFFFKDYNGNLGNLPGIEKEKEELKKVLSKYNQEVVTEAKGRHK